MKLALPAPMLFGAGLALAAIPLGLALAQRYAPQIAVALDPSNPDNAVAAAANRAVQRMTGDAGATVGTTWWETINPAAVAAERAAIYGTEAAPHEPTPAYQSPWDFGA